MPRRVVRLTTGSSTFVRRMRLDFETAIPVGKGATGEVAKAWDSSLNRWVALKFLRHDTPEAQERMLREARAQAKIEHPNVCRVYDVGERDGRRYIAMQYIEGRRLDEALAEFDVDAKVGVVQTIAEAVQAAHSAGLIHRDLKPSNILVETSEDGGFRPWVVDFGIAREQAVAGSTMTGQVIGTPGYLSPEQARGEVTTLDRRSDVFSLGVILYELLSGIRPHGGGSDADVLVSLLSEDPAPLRQIAPNIPADLETIVMTCLERDREKRYPSGRALADDLGRFLAGESIEARPMTRLERMRRKAARNPVAATLLGAASVAIVVLAFALVASWVQYTKDLEREREAALAAKEQAEQKEAEAREVADFLVELFEVADPGAAQGKSITARELLEQGAGNVEKELADQPLVQARMMGVIAEVYDRLGIRDEAATLALKSLELRRSTLGNEDLLVAESYDRVAEILRHDRRWDEAVPHLRESARIEQSRLGPDSVELARTRAGLAAALLGNREVDEAELVIRQALAVLVRQLGPDDPAVLNARVVEATLLRARQDYQGSVAIYEDVLERQRRTLGFSDPAIPVTLNNLAFMLRALGDFDGAAARYREALAVHESIYPEPHADRVQILVNLAGALHAGGHIDEAEKVLRRVVDLNRVVFGDAHWRTGTALVSGLGRSLLQQHKYAEAEPVLRQGVEIFEEGLGPDAPWTAAARGTLAASLVGLGKRDAAGAQVSLGVAAFEATGVIKPDSWNQVERAAAQLAEAGAPELAARYRGLLTEDRKPRGLEQEPSSTRR